MITRRTFRLYRPGSEGGIYLTEVGFAKWIEQKSATDDREFVEVACCQCCGLIADIEWANGQARCEKHHARNPCAIEGCTKTTSTDKGPRRDDQFLCAEHWRRFVPPRSRRRRIYHAYFRKAKRYGWNDRLAAQFWRFWHRIVADARKRSQDGHIDEAEINRLMGWD